MDMDISMDIHAKSVDMDMDGKFHIHGNPAYIPQFPQSSAYSDIGDDDDNGDDDDDDDDDKAETNLVGENELMLPSRRCSAQVASTLS